jgi:hypothetical protein
MTSKLYQLVRSLKINITVATHRFYIPYKLAYKSTRGHKKLTHFCPKFLDLYASIYGTYVKFAITEVGYILKKLCKEFR